MSTQEIKYDCMSNVRHSHRGYFFSEGAMRFFKSRIDEQQTAYFKDGVYYFISSEKRDNEPRYYTIRRMDKATGQFIEDNDGTIFAFQAWTYLYQAKRELKKFLLI